MSSASSFLSRRTTPMPSNDQTSEQTLVGELWPKKETARQLKCVERTVDRYEREPNGLPFVMVGGKKYHKPASVRAWLAARERQLNPRRQSRSLKSASAGMPQ